VAAWFGAFLLKRAAGRHASRLRQQLMRDYGAGEVYTEAQVRAAIRKSGLPEKYIDLGLAAFLPEDVFRKTAGAGADYHGLRALFQASLKRPQPGFDPVPERQESPPG
jgi:hypothetical protein